MFVDFFKIDIRHSDKLLQIKYFYELPITPPPPSFACSFGLWYLAILLFIICIIIELETWKLCGINLLKVLSSSFIQILGDKILIWSLQFNFLFSQINIFFNPKNKFTKKVIFLLELEYGKEGGGVHLWMSIVWPIVKDSKFFNSHLQLQQHRQKR